MLQLDHIAISGPTLDDATAYVEQALGVALQPGGQHARFGTHNTLLGLEEGLYLEAIAVDPAAAMPDRPRWFDLDRMTGPPALTNWICRTEDMAAALAALGPDAGQPVALSRGALRWQMAVPPDGRLPYDNRFPALIQWQCAQHPATMLAPSGVRLRRLVVAHPRAAELRDQLAPLLTEARVVYEPAAQTAMLAEFDTPHGMRVLQ